MTTEPVALYSCVAADDAKRYAFLMGCLIMQMFGTLISIAGQPSEAKHELIPTNESRCLPKGIMLIISHLLPFVSQMQPYYATTQKTLANLSLPLVPPAPTYAEIAVRVVTPSIYSTTASAPRATVASSLLAAPGG